MLIPFIVGFIAVLLTCLTQQRQNGLGLKAAFVIIFIFLALRYDYGNDYIGYMNAFNALGSNFAHRSTYMLWEPGWLLLNAFFQPFGFFKVAAFITGVLLIVTVAAVSGLFQLSKTVPDTVALTTGVPDSSPPPPQPAITSTDTNTKVSAALKSLIFSLQRSMVEQIL